MNFGWMINTIFGQLGNVTIFLFQLKLRSFWYRAAVLLLLLGWNLNYQWQHPTQCDQIARLFLDWFGYFLEWNLLIIFKFLPKFFKTVPYIEIAQKIALDFWHCAKVAMFCKIWSHLIPPTIITTFYNTNNYVIPHSLSGLGSVTSINLWVLTQVAYLFLSERPCTQGEQRLK